MSCNACDRVCPALLAPRDLLGTIQRDEGLTLAERPAMNHCLSCGDCIEACEHVLGRRGIAPIPLSFAFGAYEERLPAPSNPLAPPRPD